jgi:transcriptional regulator with XRE-family HTH domain
MESIGHATRNAREAAGLSIRALGKRAGFAASTISRIESGQVDPGVATVQTILHASGYTLRLEIVRSASFALSSLANAWRHEGGRDIIDWTRIRLFLDYLAVHPDVLPDAINQKPKHSGSLLLDALLASIAEKVADDAHQTRPRWTSLVSPLSRPTFFVPTSPTTRKRITESTPVQFLSRGVMIDEQSLWRPAQESNVA